MSSEIKIPFGKHAGTSIAELPLRYCEWLRNNVRLYGAVERAVMERLGEPMPTPEPELTQDERIDLAVQKTIERLSK